MTADEIVAELQSRAGRRRDDSAQWLFDAVWADAVWMAGERLEDSDPAGEDLLLYETGTIRRPYPHDERAFCVFFTRQYTQADSDDMAHISLVLWYALAERLHHDDQLWGRPPEHHAWRARVEQRPSFRAARSAELLAVEIEADLI